MGLVEEFWWNFEGLAAALLSIPKEILESTLIERLSLEITAKARLHRPSGLGQIMEVAQQMEERNMILEVAKGLAGTKLFKPRLKGEEAKLSESFPTRVVTMGKKSPNQCQEFQLKRCQRRIGREKGLCFRCNEKYPVGHIYKNRELRVLLVQEKDGVDGDEENTQTNCLQVEVADQAELLFNSVEEQTTPGTMKMILVIGEKEVTVLVDCGPTHNFISLNLMQQLELPTRDRTNYWVIMGKGVALKGKGICKGVMLEPQGLTMVENFFPFGIRQH